MTSEEFEERLDEILVRMLYGKDVRLMNSKAFKAALESLAIVNAKPALRQLFLKVLAAELKHDDYCDLNTADLAHWNPEDVSCSCSYEGMKIRLAELRSIINGNARKES